MQITQSRFSGYYAQIKVQFDTKEQIINFGPFAPPLGKGEEIKDPLSVIDLDLAAREISSQSGQPEDDVRRAIDRYLVGVGRFTTPEDWYNRFKAAGGRGRVDAEKIWFGESGPLSQEALRLITELQGPGTEEAYAQVVAYVQERHRGFVGWADF